MFQIACLTVQKLALIFLILFALLYIRLDYKVQTDTAPRAKFHRPKLGKSEEKTLEILSVMDPEFFDSQVRLDVSHPLENSCKYPLLNPEDPNIADYVQHVRYMTCNPVLPDLIRLYEGVLYVNQPEAFRLYNQSIICSYRPFAGALRPHVTDVTYLESWKSFSERTGKIFHDQFEVKCATRKDQDATVYRNAFAQVTDKSDIGSYANSGDNTLSVDIIGLDSTSLNMFRRHMRKTWDFFTNMGAYHMEGYNKVADNSMVNWIPVFTGLRYGNQSATMPSDFPTTDNGKPFDLENVPFIWKDFQRKKCVTMMNDDPMHYTRGLFHYPWEEVAGFRTPPTDHYFRPWHVYHRKWPTNESSNFCFNNEPYFKLQLNLAEQMIHRYERTCHFSFSFFTDITHDDPNNLELLDESMSSFLERSYDGGHLNNTVLIITGDHGHRIGAIQYTYVGRIEERAPLLAIYFPQWFRSKHPKIMENFRRNVYRLTSNYDLFQTLSDILNEKFDGNPAVGRLRGRSLFEEIPKDRTCTQANVPEHHCLCMVSPDKDSQLNYVRILEWSKEIIRNFTWENLNLFPKCESMLNVSILNVTFLTTSQMIQHGVRNQLPEFTERLNTINTGRIEYLEFAYRLAPANVTALIRLQYDKWFNSLSVNVPPLPSEYSVEYCSRWIDMIQFCACTAVKRKV